MGPNLTFFGPQRRKHHQGGPLCTQLQIENIPILSILLGTLKYTNPVDPVRNFCMQKLTAPLYVFSMVSRYIFWKNIGPPNSCLGPQGPLLEEIWKLHKDQTVLWWLFHPRRLTGAKSWD